MKRVFVLSTVLGVALVALPLEANAKRHKRGVVQPSAAPIAAPIQTPVDGVPLVGTVVAAPLHFLARPSPQNAGAMVGAMACAPFELIGARCR